MPPTVNTHGVAVKETFPWSVAGDTTNRSTSAGNSTAAVSLAAQTSPNRPYIISQVAYSYSAAPTGGRLTIESGADTLVDLDITVSGPGVITLEPPLHTYAGSTMRVALHPGGGTVVGKINCNIWIKD